MPPRTSASINVCQWVRVRVRVSVTVRVRARVSANVSVRMIVGGLWADGRGG